MSSDPKEQGRRGALPVLGLILLPLLCCGMPLLIAAGALGVFGAVGSVLLGNPWVIIGAVVSLTALLVWWVMRRRRAVVEDGCRSRGGSVTGRKQGRGKRCGL